MGTIFSWSVPWQEGRAEKHGQAEGLAKVRVKRQTEESEERPEAAGRPRKCVGLETSLLREGLDSAQSNRRALGTPQVSLSNFPWI